MAKRKVIVALTVLALLWISLSRCRWLSNIKLPRVRTMAITPASVNSVRILFHTNRCSFRGHDAATFDYAFFGELFYHMEAYHSFPEHAVLSQSQWNKLETFFPARVLPLTLPDGRYWRDDPSTYSAAVEAIVGRYNIHYLYKIEDGTETKLVSTIIPTLVHSTGDCGSSHGQRIMAIFSHISGNGCAANVPQMVWVADCGHHDLRGHYGIPNEAIVYGWIGARPGIQLLQDL